MAIDPDPNLILTLVSLTIAAIAGLALAIITRQRLTRRDPQRLFSWTQKKAILARAGYRCEHKHPFWKRCQATSRLQADHVIPWSRGGLTISSNSQALCRVHNRSKSNHMPRTIYIWRLVRRRRKY